MKAGVLLVIGTLALPLLSVQAETVTVQPTLPPDMRDRAQEAAHFFAKKWYDAAAHDYQIMLKAYPDSLYAWSNLGVVRFQQEHYPDALDAFLHAARIEPRDAFAQSNLGLTYFQMKRFPEASHALEIAITLNPRDINAHTFLGLSYEQMGRKAEARKEIDKAKELENITP